MSYEIYRKEAICAMSGESSHTLKNNILILIRWMEESVCWCSGTSRLTVPGTEEALLALANMFNNIYDIKTHN